MKRWLCANVGKLILAACALSSSAEAAVFSPDTFTLSNGLRFVVVQNRLSPAVSQMVWYKVGAVDEEPGKSGLAHYLEHLMFKGTDSVPAGFFSASIAAEGGRDNAFTTHDATAYYEEVAADRLGLVMQLEADRMKNLSIDPDAAATELHVIRNERHERTDNSPQGLFREKVARALFQNNPYGRPVIGEREDLERLTPDDARHFYKKYYAPNNAVVVISGNVELQEVMRLATATFGRLPAKEINKPLPLLKVKALREKRLSMRDPRVEQSHMEISCLVPSRATQKDDESYALELLQEILGGDGVGKLYRSLVLEKNLSSGLLVDYTPQARGESVFRIIAVPQPTVSLPELEAALRSEISKILRQGISKTEIAAAKKRLQRAAIFARDSLTASGHILGDALTTGQTIDDVESWPDKIQKVKAEKINSALQKLVSTDFCLTATLEPEGATP